MRLLVVLNVLVACLLLFHRAVPNAAGQVGSLVETFLPWLGLGVPVLLGLAWWRRSRVAALAVGLPLAAWLGLVPRQQSTGGKQVLGKISKMGQRDIRRLLIIGAMTLVRAALRKGAPEGSWLQRMLARKPKMLVAIALANKMARSVWAMLAKGEDFRVPAVAAI